MDNQNKQSEQNKNVDESEQSIITRWIRKLFFFTRKTKRLSQTRKAIVVNDLVDSSSPGIDYFILIILSCTIATFGLLTDSAAVIIGAMLVAPLMSPILSLSMASISGLSRLFRRSLLAVLQGAGTAIILSAVIAFFSYRLPFGLQVQIPGEVLARTSPSSIDLGIALAGGAAAAYALAHPRLTAALPGVAIATALMPPLCTVGIGIAFSNSSIIFGALLLFITNMVAISFAGIVTFALMGFGARDLEKNNKLSQSLTISAVLVIIIGLLLAALTWNTVSEVYMYNQVNGLITEKVSQYTDFNLVDLSISSESDGKHITATLRTTRELTYEEVSGIQSELREKLNGSVSLKLVTIPMQVFDLEISNEP